MLNVSKILAALDSDAEFSAAAKATGLHTFPWPGESKLLRLLPGTHLSQVITSFASEDGGLAVLGITTRGMLVIELWDTRRPILPWKRSHCSAIFFDGERGAYIYRKDHTSWFFSDRLEADELAKAYEDRRAFAISQAELES